MADLDRSQGSMLVSNTILLKKGSKMHKSPSRFQGSVFVGRSMKVNTTTNRAVDSKSRISNANASVASMSRKSAISASVISNKISEVSDVRQNELNRKMLRQIEKGYQQNL